MARFDVYRVDGQHVVDVQTDLLYSLTTRLVVPLIPLSGGPIPATRLNPVLDFDGELYSFHPQLMSALPAQLLRRPAGDVRRHYDKIVAAIDMIFLGF